MTTTTHVQHANAQQPARPCTAHDINFGGSCFNCGYDPERVAAGKPTHTPGPWEVQDNTELDGVKGQIRVDSVTHGCVAICWNGYQQDPQYFDDTYKANATLIAAAPDLLEACKYVVRYHREHDSGEGELFGLDFVTACISAIHKAEGRG